MSTLFNTKVRNIPNISISKDKIKKALSKEEKMEKFIKNKKNISNLLTKYDNSQGFSTQNYTTQNEYKTDHDTAKTLPSLDFIDITRDKTLITNYKPTKLTLRNNSSKNKRILNKGMNELNSKHSKNILKKKINSKKMKNFPKCQGVPLEFMEAMRLDLNSNIIKANQFIKDEKKRLIKENPNLKYYILSENKKMKEKKERLRIAYEYRIRKNYLNKNKKNKNDNNLNDYYSKLLLKENEQHFNINRPMIDKNKFNKKFLILKNDVEEKKIYPNKNVRLIFSKLLYDKVFMNNEKKIIQITKGMLYKKFILALKKSAIEFKIKKIPFNEYIEYYYKSKNIGYQIFNNEYTYLTGLIKRDKKENKAKKDKQVVDFLDKNKLPLYIVDFFGKSILFLATKYKLYKSISKIVLCGGNVNTQDFNGKTALHFAVMNNDLIAVSLLLYFLADPNIKDKNGNYPIDYINKVDDYYIIKELLDRVNIIKKINKYRSWKEFDVCIRRGIQFYLLHAIHKDKYDLIFDFIEKPVLYYK